MSKMYEKIKKYYDTGLWSEERVRNMVIKGIITEEEYKDIVGREYEEEQLLIFYSILLIKGNSIKGLVTSVARLFCVENTTQIEIFIGKI